MTTGPLTHADIGANSAAPAPVSRRRGWLLVALLALLLLVLAAAGALRWRTATRTAFRTYMLRDNRDDPPRPSHCVEDDDPKIYEPLDFGPPIVTKFGPRHLNALADRSIPAIEVYPWQPEGLVAVLGEHRMRGSLVTASPDGKLLAVAHPGSPYLRIGPVDTIHEKLVLTCSGGAQAITWGPNGEGLAVSCGDGLVRLYDVRDLEKAPNPLVLERATALVTCLALSADGKYLIGGDNAARPGTAWVWSAATGKVVNRLRHSGPVLSVAFSPIRGDYRVLTAGGPEDGRLCLWNAITGNQTAPAAFIDFNPPGLKIPSVYVGKVAFSPDGKRALSCHPDQAVRLWDLSRLVKDQELRALKEHTGLPLAAFSRDGKHVATSLRKGGVWLWSAQTGAPVRQLASPSVVHALRFLGEGDRLVFTSTISNDYNAHVHEVDTGKELRPPVGHLTSLSCVALSPDGQRPATGGADHAVRLWDLGSLEQRRTIGASHVSAVGFSPDAKLVFFHSSSSPLLNFADAENGQARTPSYKEQHSGGMLSAAITADGRYAVSGGTDGTVRMWRLKDGMQVRRFEGEGPAHVTLSPDMRRAIRVGGSKTRLLQLRCQRDVHEWAPVAWAPFLPDATAVLFGGPTAPVWQVAGEIKELSPIKLSLAGMAAGHLSADGKRVAVLLGGKVAVYDLGPPRPVWEWAPPPHFGGVGGVALSPNGKHLLTANGDGTAYIIRLVHSP